MAEQRGLLRNALSMVGHNKRYIFWFWLLNLLLAFFGAAAFSRNAHALMDHSFYGGILMHRLDLGVLAELLLHPNFGSMAAVTTPAVDFSLVFFVVTVLFLPGVLAGYASTHRLPREDFFRACGRNLWRFVRLTLVGAVIIGVVGGILFALNDAIAMKAAESTNELLPFELRMTGLGVIFLVMTTLRIWFDLAECDVVLSDQRAVRRSIFAGFRHALRNLARLLGTYVLITFVVAIILVAGLGAWMKLVPPESIVRAFFVSQITLSLLLIPRFWQRGIAVTYWQREMVAPVAAVSSIPEPPLAPVPSVSGVLPSPGVGEA